MKETTIITFDYSGTLSLEAVKFACPANLMNEFRKSGLLNLGLTSSALFWDQIVNPSWQEGSTTPIGYASLLTRSVKKIFHPPVADSYISQCAAKFVNSYLSHSRIDLRWGPLLRFLQRHSDVRVIIATDHYAEATSWILKHLEEQGIEAFSLKDAVAKSTISGLMVANSSDVGYHKTDERFWQMVKATLKMDCCCRFLIVDDFGYNEALGDSYRERQKVEVRKQQTVLLLENVFPCTVIPVYFLVESLNDEVCNEKNTRIDEVSKLIKQHLGSENID